MPVRLSCAAIFGTRAAAVALSSSLNGDIMGHQNPTGHPTAFRRRPTSRTRWALAIAASASALLATASVSSAAPAVRQTVDVVRIDGAANDGSATLTRTNSGVSMTMSTTVGGVKFDLPFSPPPDPGLGEDWEVGDATTNWFVVFNTPDGCTDPCGEDDVIAGIPEGGPAGVGIHYAAGHVAGSASWHSAGSLREGDTSGILFGLPLIDAMTAEVHIVARSHGAMASIPPGSERGYALNSVDGGCAANVCGDAQAAIFAPPS